MKQPYDSIFRLPKMKQIKLWYIKTFVVKGQILGSSTAKEDHLAAYLSKVQDIIKQFKNSIFIKVPRV